jgi:hypothetical protein
MKLTDKSLSMYTIYLQIGICTDLPADEEILNHVPYLHTDAQFLSAGAKENS